MLNLVGINTGAGAEVETATQALRVTQRALDVSSGGSFRLTSRSGIMAAGLAANSPVYAMRNASGTLLTVVNRIRISAWSLGTAFAVGLGTAELYRATAWTAADTGGVTDVITTVQGKLRTTFNSIASLAEIRHSATATLSAGTRTLDSQPMEARQRRHSSEHAVHSDRHQYSIQGGWRISAGAGAERGLGDSNDRACNRHMVVCDHGRLG